ncbi:MAG: nucleotide exchange factor GrpE [Blastocatellia bacterium]|nr:nucleotide exchange factor GrpE [Blastocatellia bacterium]MCS7157895.1 nucleotide exchange factor GrpE [Blastocatellia bacterium]MDW8168027.1 nucleotide exchange factor GrpE [Acidobacteriota bacterium]MDW8255767.1 nucleotide exchange factor GrpE [Acidobacteriota bacterium]
MEKPNVRRIPIRFAEDHGETGYTVRPSEDSSTTHAPTEPETEELGATIHELGQELLEPSPQLTSASAEEGSALAQWQQEKQALYDRLVRLAAEFDNYRKRIERERERMREDARAEVLTEFLPIVDDFERALEGAELVRDMDGLLYGLRMIHRRLLELLARFNVRPIETIGQRFDPTRHEAFAIEPTDEFEENTILDEYQRGYLIGDRLLRPARVKVAVRPTSNTSSPPREPERSSHDR